MKLKELPLSKAVLVALYYIGHEANTNEVIDWLDEHDYFFYKFLPEYKSIYNALYNNYRNSLVDKIGPFFVMRWPEQVSIVKNIDLDDIDDEDNNINGSEDYNEDDEDSDASNTESNSSSSWLSAYNAAMAAYSSAMEAYKIAMTAI